MTGEPAQPAPQRPHSPELWTQDRKDPRMVIDAEGRLVAVTTTREDADRIVAGVNAARGLPASGLGAGPILDRLQALFELCRYHSDEKFRELIDKDGGVDALFARGDTAWRAYGEESFRR